MFYKVLLCVSALLELSFIVEAILSVDTWNR
jgi:hypothetical protein